MNDPPIPIAPSRVAENLARVRESLAEAAFRAGRRPGEVRLVGVVKTVDVASAAALLRAGCADLGENRPEELARKSADPALAGAAWHLIGTYQRRKIRDTLERISLVHSVHSVELLSAVERRAAELGRTAQSRQRVLLEVNVAGETQKQGFAPDDVGRALAAADACPHVVVEGLMTMAPLGAASDDLRRVFSAARALRDRHAYPGRPLRELSMGMSGDFVEAVLEGATLVRIGTALFR